jgi:hypothetical protein
MTPFSESWVDAGARALCVGGGALLLHHFATDDETAVIGVRRLRSLRRVIQTGDRPPLLAPSRGGGGAPIRAASRSHPVGFPFRFFRNTGRPTGLPIVWATVAGIAALAWIAPRRTPLEGGPPCRNPSWS